MNWLRELFCWHRWRFDSDAYFAVCRKCEKAVSNLEN